MSGLSIIAIPLAIAAVVLLFGYVGCSFTPGVAPPANRLYTEPATDITCGSATLNGTVFPGGEDATYQFQYGTAMAFGGRTPLMSTDPTTFAVSAPISGLTPGTVYSFALVGFLPAGDALSFSTLAGLGFWPLNEDAGATVALDGTGNHFDGAYRGGVVLAVPDLQAVGGGAGPERAARFDGTGDVFVAPFHAELNPPSFRIDVLAMASAVPAAGTYSAVISTLDGTNHTGYAIHAGPTGYWELLLGDGSTASSLQSAFITSNAAVMANQIVALSASYDASDFEATLTVTPDALTAIPDVVHTVTRRAATVAYMPRQVGNVRIGSDYTGGHFFSGALANVYVCPL